MKTIPTERRAELVEEIEALLVLGSWAEVREDGTVLIDGMIKPTHLAGVAEVLLDVATLAGIPFALRGGEPRP